MAEDAGPSKPSEELENRAYEALERDFQEVGSAYMLSSRGRTRNRGGACLVGRWTFLIMFS